jgi:nucleoid-associated protein YgaU
VVLPGTAGAAEGADTLRAIAGCESGSGPRSTGRPDVTGYSGRHYGLFQFDLSTWRSVGGVGNPAKASVSEQYHRASLLLAQRGTQPWKASEDCWATVVAPARPGQLVVSTPSPRGTPVRTVQGERVRGVDTTGSRVPDGYRVQRGDTLGRLAARYGTSVSRIASANGIANPDRIYVRQRLV